jgi:uncharacterized Tic20 family protein
MKNLLSNSDVNILAKIKDSFKELNKICEKNLMILHLSIITLDDTHPLCKVSLGTKEQPDYVMFLISIWTPTPIIVNLTKTLVSEFIDLQGKNDLNALLTAVLK